MTHSHLAITTALLACLTLSACSADKAPQGAPSAPAGAPAASGPDKAQPFKEDTVPLTKQLSQGDLTQAIPDAKDVVPGYWPGTGHKSQPGKSYLCDPPHAPANAPAPAGWQRAGQGDYDYQGSTSSRGIDLVVCQFDTAAHAKAAHDQWQENEERTPVEVPARVGEESVFLAHLPSGMVFGYSRSGTVIARISVEDTGGDPADAYDVLAATIKRLQQVQAGRRATATAAEITEAERARR